MRITTATAPILAMLLAAAACQQDVPEQRAVSQPSETTEPAASKPPALPEPPVDDVISHEGTLEMARTYSGKRFQPTTLLRDDGSTLILSYRPMPDSFHLVGQRVRVTGKAPSFDGREQRVGGEHFTPQTIEALDGKTREVIEKMPATPRLSKVADAASLHGRWVHAHGSYEDAQGISGDGSWVLVRFMLEGDEAIVMSMASSTHKKDWAAMQGKPVTVEGQLVISEEEGALGPVLMATPILLCEGYVEGCTALHHH